MNMFLIIGRDGGLEISNEEFAAALQQAAENCQCPKCTERRAGTGEVGVDTARMPPDGKVQVGGINWDDVSIDTYRAPGQGGWSQATSAVRLTHKPTGIIVACDTERSAHANKAKAWEQLQDAVKQFNDRRAELGFILGQAGWGTGWQAGETVNIEMEERLELAPDQFAFVDFEAGTAIFENVNEPASRVRAELVKRGWTPPGEGVSIQYPDVMRSTGTSTEGTAPTAYRNGWNDCRIATMTLNRADRNGNRS